jgi:hypothetical protein
MCGFFGAQIRERDEPNYDGKVTQRKGQRTMTYFEKKKKRNEGSGTDEGGSAEESGGAEEEEEEEKEEEEPPWKTDMRKRLVYHGLVAKSTPELEMQRRRGEEGGGSLSVCISCLSIDVRSGYHMGSLTAYRRVSCALLLMNGVGFYGCSLFSIMGLNEDQKPTNKTKATWASDSSDEGGAERWKDKVGKTPVHWSLVGRIPMVGPPIGHSQSDPGGCSHPPSVCMYVYMFVCLYVCIGHMYFRCDNQLEKDRVDSFQGLAVIRI